ncbi:MAG: hypothetical protein R2834_14485 [Rhodothermales bacterium]
MPEGDVVQVVMGFADGVGGIPEGERLPVAREKQVQIPFRVRHRVADEDEHFVEAFAHALVGPDAVQLGERFHEVDGAVLVFGGRAVVAVDQGGAVAFEELEVAAGERVVAVGFEPFESPLREMQGGGVAGGAGVGRQPVDGEGVAVGRLEAIGAVGEDLAFAGDELVEAAVPGVPHDVAQEAGAVPGHREVAGVRVALGGLREGPDVPRLGDNHLALGAFEAPVVREIRQVSPLGFVDYARIPGVEKAGFQGDFQLFPERRMRVLRRGGTGENAQNSVKKHS